MCVYILRKWRFLRTSRREVLQLKPARTRLRVIPLVKQAKIPDFFFLSLLLLRGKMGKYKVYIIS